MISLIYCQSCLRPRGVLNRNAKRCDDCREEHNRQAARERYVPWWKLDRTGRPARRGRKKVN